ncbi:hypothetical protein GDO81_000477 [Engystomops pustulosus]|uniref:Uncharacterized protein n=1 Tax=Engystomops pustulosus TaxID=76066 RepID=A0AAV7D4J9_ENGPU|nr:hypothetical protein GDO81_000477 [Engystomops pustulosus]
MQIYLAVCPLHMCNSLRGLLMFLQNVLLQCIKCISKNCLEGFSNHHGATEGCSGHVCTVYIMSSPHPSKQTKGEHQSSRTGTKGGIYQMSTVFSSIVSSHLPQPPRQISWKVPFPSAST